MKLETSNLEHLKMIQAAAKKNHSVPAITDDGSHIKVFIAKNAPSELDSLIDADYVFSVIGPNGQASITEFEYVTVSEKNLNR